jgi:hypothetical protein
MSDGIGPESVSIMLTRQEWGVVVAALYEAPLPLKLTGQVTGKIQMQLQPAPQPAPQREGTP